MYEREVTSRERVLAIGAKGSSNNSLNAMILEPEYLVQDQLPIYSYRDSGKFNLLDLLPLAPRKEETCHLTQHMACLRLPF